VITAASKARRGRWAASSTSLRQGLAGQSSSGAIFRSVTGADHAHIALVVGPDRVRNKGEAALPQGSIQLRPKDRLRLAKLCGVSTAGARASCPNQQLLLPAVTDTKEWLRLAFSIGDDLSLPPSSTATPNVVVPKSIANDAPWTPKSKKPKTTGLFRPVAEGSGRGRPHLQPAEGEGIRRDGELTRS